MTRATSLLAAAAVAGFASAGIQDIPGHEWMAPGPDDLRSPCPGLNVLANHGFLNRSGRNITRDALYNNIQAVYNLDDQMAGIFADSGVRVLGPTLPEITLADLRKHDSIEHDASLTRADAITGNDWSLVPSMLAALIADADGPTLSITSLAKSRNRRFKESLANGGKPLNAKFKTLAWGEAALILQALGPLANDPLGALLPPKADVQTWFSEERLPANWKKPDTMSLGSTLSISGQVQVAANAQSGGALGALAVAPIDLIGALAGGAATLAGQLTPSKWVSGRRAVKEQMEKRYLGHGMWA